MEFPDPIRISVRVLGLCLHGLLVVGCAADTGEVGTRGDPVGGDRLSGTELCGPYFPMSRPLITADQVTSRFFELVLEDCRLNAFVDGLDDTTHIAYANQMIAFTLWLLDCEFPDELEAPPGSFAPAFVARDRDLPEADVDALLGQYMRALVEEVPLRDRDVQTLRDLVTRSAAEVPTCSGCESPLNQCEMED